MSPVQPRFSDRIGVTQIPTMLEINSMSEALRATLWNVIHAQFDSPRDYELWAKLAKTMAVGFTKFRVDDLPVQPWDKKKWVRDQYEGMPWYDVYNFVEFLIDYSWFVITGRPGQNQGLVEALNRALEAENSGYRLVDRRLAPITNETERGEVEAAVISTQNTALNGANEHLRTAISLFSQKPAPDYRNATKEAISAIESIAKVLGDADAPGLAGALGALNKKAPIHQALYQAFVRLYGYASDEGGIRHALGENASNVGFDEAKYMIVSCSAFMNYLIAKADASGLLSRK